MLLLNRSIVHHGEGVLIYVFSYDEMSWAQFNIVSWMLWLMAHEALAVLWGQLVFTYLVSIKLLQFQLSVETNIG